jgi:translocation and assembly module TamB
LADAPNNIPPDAPEEPSASLAWRAVRTGAWALIVLLLLVGAVLIGLQTDAVGTFVAQQATARFNPFEGTTLTVGSASGSWLNRLRLTDVRITRVDSARGDTLEMARIDTLTARYRVLSLLQNRFHLTEATVAGPHVTMRQAPDSTWDWARALGLDEEADTTTSDFQVRLDEATLRRGGWEARFHAPQADSVARVAALRVRLRDLVAGGDAFRLRLDTLGLRGQAPGDTATLHLASRAALTENRFRLDTLRLRSRASRVDAGGTVRLGGPPATNRRDVRFRLDAAPLAFRDLAVLAPPLNLDPRETVALRVRTRGTRSLLKATLDARFDNGGRLDATATVSPYTTPPPSAPPPDSLALRYRLNARLQTLSTSLLAPRDPSTNRLSGRLRADLRGPALDSLNGRLRLSLRQTRLYGLQTDSLRLRAGFTRGAADVALGGRLNRATVALDGQVRPLDRVPTYNLRGDVRDLNLAAFAPDGAVESQIAGTLRASGRAFQGDSLNLGLAVTLRPSTVGVQRIQQGEATVRVTPDTVLANAGLTFPQGDLQLAGHGALDGSQRFRLTEGRFRQAPLLALVGDTTRSALTGTLRAQGQGFDPRLLALEATLAVDTLTYDRFRAHSLQTEVALNGGLLQSRTAGTVNGGDWSFRLTGRPLDARPRLRLTEGRFRNVNIGPLLGDTTQASALNGTLNGTLRGTDVTRMTLDATVALDSSRVNRGRIHAGTLTTTLDAGTLSSTLALATPGGGARMAIRAQPFRDTPTYALPEGTFERLDVAALAGLPADTTALSGRLSLVGEGQSFDDLVLEATLALDTTQVNQATLSSGTLALEARGARASLTGDLRAGAGRFRLDATIDSLADGRPAYAVDVRADTLDLGAFAPRDTVGDAPAEARLDTLRWMLDGRGTDPKTLTATTSLRVAGLHTAGIWTRNLRLDGHLDRGVLTVDTVDVASTVALINGSGQLALFDTTAASRFDLYAEATGASPLRDLVGAERLSLRAGRAELHVAGDNGTLVFDGGASVRDLFYNSARLGETTASFSGRASVEDGLQRLDSSVQLTFLSLPGIAVQRVTAQATYAAAQIDLTASARLRERYSATLGATIDTRSGNEQITLRQLDLRLQSDRWRLLQEATITYANAYRVRGLLLLSGNQQIAADGIVRFNGRQSLIVTAEQVRMAPVANLVGLAGLGGRVTGTIDLSGTAAAPTLDSRLSLDVTSGGDDVGTLSLSVSYADFAVRTDARLVHTAGGTLSVTGTLPADLRLARPAPVDIGARNVDLAVRADNFSVGWIDPFVDPSLARDIRGALLAEVDIGGTLDRPSFAGEMQLLDGNVYLPGLDTRYDRGQVILAFEDAQVRVRDARLRSGNGGRLRAAGRINFSALTLGAFDLDITADDFIAIDTRAYRTLVIDGDLDLQGTTRRPVLNGSVAVERGDVYYAEATDAEDSELATVRLTKADQRTLEERFDIRLTEADTTTFDAYQALAMDLSVRIESDTWIRSEGTPELNIQFTGDLNVTKSVNQDAQVFGAIEVVSERSTIRQFGQEFRIENGTLTFNGDPTMPYLRVTAVYEQRARQSQEAEVTITLALEGRPENLTPTLSSNPPMETRNILAYLATGQPANQLLGGGNGQSENLATRVALGQATNFVENLAASELGLDVVRIQLRPNGTSYLALGRYFTPRFFASIEQPVTPPTSQTTTSTSPFVPDLTLEYQLNRFLRVRAQNRQQALQLNLLIERAY